MASEGLHVSVSAPVLVLRRKGECWFPMLMRLANGDVVASISTAGDAHHYPKPGALCRSRDGGRTWGEPVAYSHLSYTHLRLPAGDELLLPYYLQPLPAGGGIGAPHNVLPGKGGAPRLVEQPVTVTGWPKEIPKHYAPGAKIAPFVFQGKAIRLRDGGHLATMYGHFAGERKGAHSLVAAESKDGLRWRVRSVIYDGTAPAAGGVSAMNESSLCRLPDGRLMCIARPHYAQTFSRDEGKTWTPPVRNRHFGHGGVEPALVTMGNGVVAFSGGRPGVVLRFNADGSGKTWQAVDVLAHHNAHRPGEPLVHHAKSRKNYGWGTPTGYTDIIALDDHTLLMAYDRTASTWPPKATAARDVDTDSVWVVRVAVRRTAQAPPASQAKDPAAPRAE